MKKLLAIVLMLGMGAMALGNGLSLNSVGVRAMGMGGAYAGYANDATAIYWNPAGLAGQKSHALLFGTTISPIGSYKFDGSAIGMNSYDADMVSNTYFTGNLFLNYQLNKKMNVGLGVFVPAGLGAEWDNVNMSLGKSLMSKIGAVTFAPAFAYQINKKFSVGATINITYAMFDMDQPVPASGSTFQFSESSTGLGYGATVGAKFDATKDLSVGATFRLASTVAMSGDATNDVFPLLGLSEKSSFDRDVTWPMWIAGGVAYKGVKNLVITADLQYSNWSELDKLTTDYSDAGWKANMDGDMVLKWDNAIQYRVGAEYMLNKSIAVRGGYYYDPAPSPDETLSVLFPSSTNNVLTAGFSWTSGKFTAEMALEYLLGADREVTTTVAPGASYTATHHLDVFAFGFGVGYAL